MSLLRKIRRPHKAFLLKRSAQRNSEDGAGSVSSAEAGEDGDEDEDSYGKAAQAGQLKAADVPSFPASITAPTFVNSVQQSDVSAQTLIRIPSYTIEGTGDDVDFSGEVGRFWPQTAKAACFFIVAFGAFYIGKVAVVGITLCFVLASKFFARNHIDRSWGSKWTEPRQDNHSDEATTTILHPDSLFDKDLLTNMALHEDNGPEENMECNCVDKSEEALLRKANEDTVLAKTKQLKRLNCIKLPPSVSPYDKVITESSATKSSPRTWFHNAGSSMVTGSSTVDSPTESRKQAKSKSKALFRHKRKEEPQSVPSSPLCSDSEAIHGFPTVMDGSDSERSVHVPSLFRKSKLKPETCVVDADIRTLDEAKLESSASGKMEKKQNKKLPDTSTTKGNGKGDSFAAFFCKRKLKLLNINDSLFKKDRIARSKAPILTSEDAMENAEAPVSLGTDQGVLPRSGGISQSSLNPVAAPISKSSTATRGNAASTDQDLLRAVFRKGGERKQQRVRVGATWLTSGLAIVTAGLLMGRIIAVAGLVCYWYVLSIFRKRRKAV